MDEWLIAVISAASGLVGGYLGYLGSIRSTKQQIKAEYEKRKEIENKNHEVISRNLQSFIIIELTENLQTLKTEGGKKGVFFDYIRNSDTPFQYGVKINFQVQDFERIKFELVKYDNEEIQDVIEFYQLLQKLERRCDVKEFSELDYRRFKTLLLRYEALYLLGNF